MSLLVALSEAVHTPWGKAAHRLRRWGGGVVVGGVAMAKLKGREDMGGHPPRCPNNGTNALPLYL